MTRPIRKLAIVGASARAAAFSAIRAGYEVVAADLFADADLQRVAPVTKIDRYPDGLADWLAQTECDAWMYTGALENHPDLIDRMDAIAPLAGNRGAELQIVRDPLVLQSAVRQARLSFPETVEDPTGLPLDGSWLCKTYRGASGSGVWALDSEPALSRATREEAVFQQRIDGWSTAVILALDLQRSEVLGNTLQFTGNWLPSKDKPWQYLGSQSPSMFRAELVEQFIRLRDLLAREFDLRGLVGVDAIVDDRNRVWILEVNPRYTASVEVVERMTGRSSISAHLAACGFATWESFGSPLRFDVNVLSRRSYCKAIVYAKRAVVVTDAFHRWAMSHSSVDMGMQVCADIPPAGEVIANGRPVLTVFADGPNFTCYEYLQARVAEVEARLYDSK